MSVAKAWSWQELPAKESSSAPEEMPLSLDLLPAPPACVPWVVLPRSVLHTMEQHARGVAVETIGLLHGRQMREKKTGHPVTRLTAATPFPVTVASPLHVKANAASWQAVWPGLASGHHLAGWFHTHPGLGVFFSETDQRTQASFFPAPWQVGLVMDPVAGEMGVFAGAACRRGLLTVVDDREDAAEHQGALKVD